MQIIHTLQNTAKNIEKNNGNNGIALTIGNFDGVHIGHQAIMKTIVGIAKERGLVSAVMTFSPHAQLFFKQVKNFLISDEDEKVEQIQSLGIEQLYHIPFDKQFSSLSAEQFATHLFNDLNVRYLLVGDDFHFGYKGQGNFALLQEMGKRYGAEVSVSPTINYDGERVSSSRIRSSIGSAETVGDFATINELLGRQLSYRGTVIQGRQLGRTIDFPTANVRLQDNHLLPQGVFAVTVTVENDTIQYKGMCNIGTKPTVDNSNTRLIEVHLFDFSGGLYGKELVISPVVKLRDEQKFNGINELVAQLHKDKQKAVEIFFDE